KVCLGFRGARTAPVCDRAAQAGRGPATPVGENPRRAGFPPGGRRPARRSFGFRGFVHHHSIIWFGRRLSVAAREAIRPSQTSEGLLDRVFKLTENGTDVKREILAGLTTFVTMSYIIAVNPDILSI